MKNLLVTLLFAVFLMLVVPQPAHAYLDPGTGSYSAQVLLAGVMVGMFSLRSVLRRAFDNITRLFKSH